MAGYLSPGAYFYTEEQEYLQAYEDVLERYKGRAARQVQGGLCGVPPPGRSGQRDGGAPAPRSAAVGRKAMTGADGFAFYSPPPFSPMKRGQRLRVHLATVKASAVFAPFLNLVFVGRQRRILAHVAPEFCH